MKRTYFLGMALLLAMAANAQTLPAWKITDVADYYSKKTDSVYVINFWATFCVPCVAEMPHLQSITKKYEGRKVKLLLVSLDLPSVYPQKIILFAKRHNITASMAWLNETDADYFCNVIDKKWSGSIPATLIVNAATGYRQFYEKDFTAEEFETELKKAISQ